MIQTLFVTKKGMGQAWTKSGARIPVTKLHMGDNLVVAQKTKEKDGYDSLQIGFGKKKLKNMTKPLRTLLTKSGFSLGTKYMREVKVSAEVENPLTVGTSIKLADHLKVGDVVNVQGLMKGRGFGGVMKRHGFHGGPRTHGQSDRARAPGSIGNRTTPGRVFKGKRMAGHYGDVNITVKNLQVVHIDPVTEEVWISGPVPGAMNSSVRIMVTDHKEFEGLQSVSKVEEVVVTEPTEVEEVIEQTETDVEASA